jgi:hypothetical protein
MPKDPSKQGHRGIGFVTYASPESGERRLPGHETQRLLRFCSIHPVRRCCAARFGHSAGVASMHGPCPNRFNFCLLTWHACPDAQWSL